MVLRKLELQGFKSFAEKTSIDLNHQITGVVGPNGSGKSNVTDGIRWLLGERDARNLRGGKGEDLIFAGSKTKPRMGLAQATLYLDNSEGKLPVKYSEVTVSRKLTRDGVSSFYLNKTEVRLKDIIDFFAKAKLGARGLTVINQGESDSFLKASLSERREMVEEILGLKEYQLKKYEAEKRLKNTGFNLEKANAMLEELKPHLRLLRKQAKKYEGREDIESELKSLENFFYGAELKDLEQAIMKSKSEEVELNKQYDLLQKELGSLTEELNKVRRAEPQSAESLKRLKENDVELSSKKSKLQVELGKIEVRLEMAGDSGELTYEETKKIVGETKEVLSKLSSENSIQKIRDALDKLKGYILKLEKKDGGQNEKIDYKSEKDTLLKELEKISIEMAELAKQEAVLRESLASFNQNFQSAYEKVDKKRKELELLQEKKSTILISKERAETKLESLEQELNQIGRSKDSFESSPKADINLSDYEIRDRMLKLRGHLSSIGEMDEGVLKEAKETEERFSFLLKQTEDLEKATSDLKILIKELDQKIHDEFESAMAKINEEFNKLIKIVFGGGKGRFKLVKPKIKKKTDEESEEFRENEEDVAKGIEIEISLPKKRLKGLDVLSGGERALVSIAALFSLISVSSPPFLFLDEVDAALDESNARKFGDILKEFSKETQFVIVTHNRATMESADALYGVTMDKDGTSKLVSIKLAN